MADNFVSPARSLNDAARYAPDQQPWLRSPAQAKLPGNPDVSVARCCAFRAALCQQNAACPPRWPKQKGEFTRMFQSPAGQATPVPVTPSPSAPAKRSRGSSHVFERLRRRALPQSPVPKPGVASSGPIRLQSGERIYAYIWQAWNRGAGAAAGRGAATGTWRVYPHVSFSRRWRSGFGIAGRGCRTTRGPAAVICAAGASAATAPRNGWRAARIFGSDSGSRSSATLRSGRVYPPVLGACSAHVRTDFGDAPGAGGSTFCPGLRAACHGPAGHAEYGGSRAGQKIQSAADSWHRRNRCGRGPLNTVFRDAS